MNTNFFGISRVKFTKEGGLAIRVINKTGAPSIKGYLCEAEAFEDSIKYVVAGDPDPIGAMYSEGVPDGEFVWVVVAGIADVYYNGSVTAATFSRVPTAAEAFPDGHAVNEALPVPPFSSDKHFQEIGHPIESRVGAGLAKTILHFN